VGNIVDIIFSIISFSFFLPNRIRIKMKTIEFIVSEMGGKGLDVTGDIINSDDILCQ
jgi:hypothetical protein